VKLLSGSGIKASVGIGPRRRLEPDDDGDVDDERSALRLGRLAGGSAAFGSDGLLFVVVSP
jgi:hypothetical protein